MQVEKYNLPDFKIFNTDNDFDFCVWIPDKVYIVLGSSNSIENSVNYENAKVDKISIVKRKSGGEGVVLSPKMLVVSVKFIDYDNKNPREHFRIINNIIISVLESYDIKDIKTKGISDLTIGNKKILGSSIYKLKNKVFYHCVINVSEDIELITRYLKHPQKEPDYRKSRSHNDFVTSIHSEGYKLDIKEMEEKFTEFFISYKLDFDFSNRHLPR